MSPHPIPTDGLGFDLAPLTIQELHTVYEHVAALWQITNGLMSQPRCSERGYYNRAGLLMDDLGERIGHQLDAIAAEAECRRPADRLEMDYRDNIIVRASLSATDPLATDLAIAFRKIGRPALVDDITRAQP